MGRCRSQSTCPKCGKQGFRSDKSAQYGRYRRFVHYDHVTKKRPECNVEAILREYESNQLRSGEDVRLFHNQVLPTGELCDRIYKFNHFVNQNLYRLGKRIDRFASADPILSGLDIILLDYLWLYVNVGQGFVNTTIFLDIEPPY